MAVFGCPLKSPRPLTPPDKHVIPTANHFLVEDAFGGAVGHHFSFLKERSTMIYNHFCHTHLQDSNTGLFLLCHCLGISLLRLSLLQLCS